MKSIVPEIHRPAETQKASVMLAFFNMLHSYQISLPIRYRHSKANSELGRAHVHVRVHALFPLDAQARQSW